MKKSKNIPELVAPAGSLEKLKYAIEYGADAVYFGVPDFSLRARGNQFSEKDIVEGIKYAHGKNKKAYITLNIIAHNKHLKKLEKFVTWLSQSQEWPDAFVVSDPGVIGLIKGVFPKIPIHLSTQANCTNWRAAKFWYDLGVKRIVLAREVSLSEIKEIKKHIPELELEIFIHGAMCMAYSGRCLLSAWLAGRSGNLGDCAQSCRWNYHMVENLRPGEFIPIEEDKHGTHILNSKDLCLIDYLGELAGAGLPRRSSASSRTKAGVDSFKIEGRAKSLHYLATTIKAYRDVIDSNYDKKVIARGKKELNKNINRGYTTGFLLGMERSDLSAQAGRQNLENRSMGSEWEYVGTIVGNRSSDNSDNDNILKPNNTVNVGDVLEVIQPIRLCSLDTARDKSGQASGKNLKIKVKKLINTKNNKEVKLAHGGTGELFVLNPDQKRRGKTNKTLVPMSILRRKKKLN